MKGKIQGEVVYINTGRKLKSQYETSVIQYMKISIYQSVKGREIKYPHETSVI